MRKISTFMVLLLSFTVGCSSQRTAIPAEFPLEKGTTWVYSYEAYEQAADPSQVVKAAYQLTETVVDVKSVSLYLVAHVKRDLQLVTADPGWTGDFSVQQEEFWYTVIDRQVFRSDQQPYDTTINTQELGLVYDFPLSVEKSWCLLQPPDSVTKCEFIGKRVASSLSSYETQTESFDDCYNLIDYFNNGNFFQTFCNGVGVVHLKFDHAGTRFGFEQTLISYSSGTP
jgi:hypothetical protein